MAHSTNAGKRLAVTGAPRQWLAKLHRWSGLTMMLLLLIASVTGVWLVFRQEIDRALNAKLRVVEPRATRLSEDEIVRLVEQQCPDDVVSLVQFPLRPDDAISLSMSPRQPGRGVSVDSLYLNQYTGEILGQRNTWRKGPAASALDSLILSIHFTLLMNATGRWLMGLAALVWLVTNVVGLALSWPAARQRLAGWVAILSPRLAGGPYKANYTMHRASAVWLLPVLTVLAFTSVELNLPQFVRPVVNALSPLSRRSAGTEGVPPEDAIITFNQAAAAVLRLFPDATVNNIYRDFSGGRHSVYFHLPEDANPQGDDFAFVDLKSGVVTEVSRPAASTAGDRFMAWLYPLHTGAAFGWTGRLLVALAGIVMIILNATGLYVWWVKWRMRRRAALVRHHQVAVS
jgi:uncharacterized iron-regulated membrane protein